MCESTHNWEALFGLCEDIHSLGINKYEPIGQDLKKDNLSVKFLIFLTHLFNIDFG